VKGLGRERPRRATLQRILPSIAILALGAFAAIIVVLHRLRPDYDAFTRHLSEYAVGRCGILMSIAFGLAGLALLLLAIGFLSSVQRSGFLKTACALLAGAALTNGLMAAFPTDLSIPEPGGLMKVTSTGRIHDALAALHAGFWLLIPPLLLLAVRRDDRWRRFLRPSAVAAAIEVISVGVVLALQHSLPGLGQRLWIGTLVGWCLWQAVLLRIVGATASSASGTGPGRAWR